jgi:hypothetical protein
MSTFDYFASVDRNLEIYEKMYYNFSPDYRDWNSKNRKYRTFQYGQFYYSVGQLGKVASPYISENARIALSDTGKLPTDDHCITPRLMYQAMMSQCPEVLLDREEFYKMVDLSRCTIQITEEQNNKVKYHFNHRGPLPKIHARTIDKYDSFGWIDKSRGSVLLTERSGDKIVKSPFPLKHLIPDWLTAFEEKCMKSHGYL